MQVHISAAQIFIIQEHVVIVGMIAGGQRAAHILGKGISVIQVGGSHQFQFVGMAAEDVFYFMFSYKINHAGRIFQWVFIGAQNGMMDEQHRQVIFYLINFF